MCSVTRQGCSCSAASRRRNEGATQVDAHRCGQTGRLDVPVAARLPNRWVGALPETLLFSLSRTRQIQAGQPEAGRRPYLANQLQYETTCIVTPCLLQIVVFGDSSSRTDLIQLTESKGRQREHYQDMAGGYPPVVGDWRPHFASIFSERRQDRRRTAGNSCRTVDQSISVGVCVYTPAAAWNGQEWHTHCKGHSEAAATPTAKSSAIGNTRPDPGKPAEEKSIPSSAPGATTTRITGATNQSKTVKTMNEKAKSEVEAGGK